MTKQFNTLLLFFSLLLPLSSLAQAPANDLRANAQLISSLPYASDTAAFTTEGSSQDKPAGYGKNLGNNVWFRFTATDSILDLRVDSRGHANSLYHLTLALFDTAGQEVAYRYYGSLASGVIQLNSLVAGQEYLLSVGSGNGWQLGDFRLSIDSQLDYDSPLAAQILTSLNHYQSAPGAYSTHEATWDKAVSDCLLGNRHNNVWFRFTASTPYIEAASLIGGAEGTMGRTQIALYTDSLTCLASDIPPYNGQDAQLSYLGLLPGQDYYLMVDNANDWNNRGSFTLTADDGFDDQIPDSLEFIALAQLYLATSGDAWTSNTGWPTADSLQAMLSTGTYPSATEMDAWEGITAWSGDVTQIRLSAKALTGSLPAQLAALSRLEALDLSTNALTGGLPGGYNALDALVELNLSYNQLSSLPDLTSLASAAALSVNLSGNFLNIGDLEPLYATDGSHPFDSLAHEQLVAPPGTQSLQTEVGIPLLLESPYTSATASYQWWGRTDGSWAELAGAQAATYDLDVSSATDWGYYRIAYTSSKIPGLVTWSQVIRAKVDIGPAATNIPDGSVVALEQTAAPTPGSTEGLVLNYVRSYTAKAPITDRLSLLQARRDSAQVSTQYLDGLGRPLQTVAHEASPSGRDIVQVSRYDGMGRSPRQYLAYSAATSPATSGTYRPNALQEQHSFYLNEPGIAHSGYAYSETAFEPSPLQRPLAQSAPGESWHMGSGKTTQASWDTNTEADSIPLWVYDSQDSLVFRGFYAAGELWLQQGTDAHGSRSRSWQDKSQQVVLQQNELDSTRWVETAFVFDAFGRPRLVLQPEGLRRIRAVGDYTLLTDSLFRSQWCFEYRYDQRGRQLSKQLPGAAPVYTLYDPWDRPVLTQDGNLRAKGAWAFSKYDHLQRPVLSGIYTDTRSREQLQTALDGLSLEQQAVVRDTSAIGYVLEGTFPFGVTEADLLSVSYFDDYRFPFAQDSTAFGYAYPFDSTAASGFVRGVPTGSMIRVLGSDAWLRTLNYYDLKGRVLQTITENQLGGQERLSNRYDWRGQVLETQLLHTVKPLSGNVDSTLITERFTYDAASGLLLAVTHQVNAEPVQELAASEYNELAQVVQKRLHGSANPLQTLDYQYNIRGWMTHINQADVRGTDDWFGMELHYDQGFEEKQYNGNIAGITWSTALDQELRAFGYTYDRLSRIQTANYRAGDAWDEQVAAFNVEGIDFDDNGNILSLKRYGQHPTQGGRIAIDDLFYGYTGNQLGEVNDAGWQDLGFTETGQGSNEYSYDPNGNMVFDANKGINHIAYNHLNLPDSVVLQSGEVIRYAYDAAGIKLGRQLWKQGQQLSNTQYLGAFLYEADSLQFISTGEGRYLPGQQRYEYFLKDHLGNTRLVVHESRTETHTLTLESSNAAAEEAAWANVAETRQTDYAMARTGMASAWVRTNSSLTMPLGPTKTIRVSKGDTIRMKSHAHYLDADAGGNGFSFTLFVTNTFDHQNSENLFGNLSLGLGFSGANGMQQTGVPYAYLKFVRYATDSTIVEEGEQLISIDAANSWDTLALSTIPDQDGFLKVYVVNESDADVWFDDFSIEHVESPISQQTDYYPYGLEIAGTRYNRSDWLYNRFDKFQGQEKDETIGWIQFKWRNHQPEIGRFFNIDPLSEKYLYNSTYAFSENRLIDGVELEGLEWVPAENGSSKYDTKESLIPNSILKIPPKVTPVAPPAAPNIVNPSPMMGLGATLGGLMTFVTAMLVPTSIGEGTISSHFDDDQWREYNKLINKKLHSDEEFTAADERALRELQELLPDHSYFARKWPWENTTATVEELNKDGGNCAECAIKIQEVIGGKVIRITDKYGAPLIGKVYTKDGKLINSQFFEHYAVRIGDQIYDRITGPKGLHIDEYKKLFEESEYLDFDNYEEPPSKIESVD